MFGRLLLAAASLTICLAGCAPPTLVKVAYDKPAQVTSTKVASIQLFTGVVEGASGTSLMYAGPNLYVPVSTGSYPKLHFNLQDQKIFAESLKDELNRLHLLRVTEVTEQRTQAADVEIDIVFVQTTHMPSMQQYYLNVAMQLKSGDQSFAKRYEVLSSEGDNILEKMSTNASDGKEKAAKKLMAQLIPDIETFVGSSK